MLRWLFLVLVIPILVLVLASDGQELALRWLPFTEPIQVPLGAAVIGFVAYGVMMAMVLALTDRVSHTRKTKQLKRELLANQEELVTLRNMLAMDRETKS